MIKTSITNFIIFFTLLSFINFNPIKDDKYEIPNNSEDISYIYKIKENRNYNEEIIDIKTCDSIKDIDYKFFTANNKVDIDRIKKISFQENYSDVEGIITFRGNNLRSLSSYGISKIENNKLNKVWEFETTWGTPNPNPSFGPWGGGAGWTGQPSVIKWNEDVKKIMNIKEKFKNKEDFIEVVYASLDGNIYFLDLETGQKTREPINIQNPIKGSVALDPRGYPLLYVGQGVCENGEFGYRIYNLINGELLYFINGIDSIAYRKWGAFDGSPLIDKETDTLVLGGENGLLYFIELNTEFDLKKEDIKIEPNITKFRYKVNGSYHQGIENSVSSYKNLIYWADNSGNIICIDIHTLEPKWVWSDYTKDDTNATITIDIENGTPYLYVGTEYDKQQNKTKKVYFRKLNGLTGRIIWENEYESFPGIGYSNGGIYSTNVIGKNNLENLIIFNIARVNKINEGLMIAINKKTGEKIWSWNLSNYTWSSPVDFYDEKGKGYLIQCDSKGNVWLLDGLTGKILNNINLGRNIEASPIIYKDMIIISERGNKIYGIKIN